jgi:hypothetical protein
MVLRKEFDPEIVGLACKVFNIHQIRLSLLEFLKSYDGLSRGSPA